MAATAFNTPQKVIDMIRQSIGDEVKPYKYTNPYLLNLFNQAYREEAAELGVFEKLDEFSGDGTNRYSLVSGGGNLTYDPYLIKRVFIDDEECPRIRRLEAGLKE